MHPPFRRSIRAVLRFRTSCLQSAIEFSEAARSLKTVKKALFSIGRIVVGVYVGLCVLLFVGQRSMIYIPQPREYRVGISLLTLHPDGQSVLVSTRPHDGDGALIYFGGNAEDVSLDMPEFSEGFPNVAIYLLHYRGYGGSSGAPTEKSLVSDALELFDLVHSQHRNVLVVGRSLGSGIAVQVAGQRPVARLVLITPYDGLKDVAAHEFPFLPVGILLKDKFESWRYAPKITAPTLIIGAGNDELVPRSSTDRLNTRFKEGVARYVVIPNAGHNTISEFQDYMTLIKSG
jgi:pimeloyl-ACP methyl ester carboxylesterase